MALEQAARDLALAVSGIDYDGAAVHKHRVAVHAAMLSASPSSLAAALSILVARIASSSVDDADGVAFAALTAGALVETGAPVQPLAEVLLAKAPSFLVAARRFADKCIADLPPPADNDGNPPPPPPPEDQVLAEVDSRLITHQVFRTHAPSDRGGASALALLQPWTLPTVAALSRDRQALRSAASPGSPMRSAAFALAQSHARWLAILLNVQLDATWLVLCPPQKRGFRLRVDGVVSNYDLAALVGDVLVERGLPGQRNPAELMALIRGDDVPAEGATTLAETAVQGQFQFYAYQAAAYDWDSGSSNGAETRQQHPAEHNIRGEGMPSGVPKFKGTRTLIVGPQTTQRSWKNPRTFGGLRCSVSVQEELAEAEVVSLLAEMKAAAVPVD